MLYEHASGYSLFRVREFEEIGMSLPQVEASVVDLSKFATVVKLVAFHPFQSGVNALDNINAVSEGDYHPYLIEEKNPNNFDSFVKVWFTMIFEHFLIQIYRKKKNELK